VNSVFYLKPFLLGFLGAASLLCASPVRIYLWQITEDSLQPAKWQMTYPLPPAQGQTTVEIKLLNGSVTLVSPLGNWNSPATWQVQQAVNTDLNHDGNPEVTLLVRRPFEPWPVDRILPHGGRIQNHQDAEGMSSHIILIGWKKDHWGEVWAGSALARPVQHFEVADLNRDGKQELVVLEGSYRSRSLFSSSSLAVWRWDGFGFELVSRVEKTVNHFVITKTRQNQEIILID
jgi:hypothetical protein